MDETRNNGAMTLCDALDRILSKGVVAHGDVVISVADVDLIRISLRALVCAVDAIEDDLASNSSTPTCKEAAA